MPDGPQNQTLCYYIEGDNRPGAAYQTGHDNPDPIHKDRVVPFTGEAPGPDEGRTDRLVQIERTRGALLSVTTYAAIGSPENSYIVALRTTLALGKKDMIVSVLVAYELLDLFFGFFGQFRQAVYILFREANPAYLVIIRISLSSGLVKHRKCLAGSLQLEVSVEQHFRSRSFGIEQALCGELAHPDVGDRKRQRQHEYHRRPEGGLHLPRQRQRPDPLDLREPLLNVT